MILTQDPIFCDPKSEDVLQVEELTPETLNKSTLSEDKFYLIGDTIYRYRGICNMSKVPAGSIIRIENSYYVEPHLEEDEPLYNSKYIISRRDYESRVNIKPDQTLEQMYMNYAKHYNSSNNLMKSGNIKIVPSGDVYMPELLPDDDPLERIIKLMLRHMKLILNDYRGKFPKKHGLDNIKSALNGATKNMSILKFLAWCEKFNLDWEITFDNIEPNVPNPIRTPITLTNNKPYPWVDIPKDKKDCFTVPLVEGEDPLKRGIKLVLGEKKIDIKDYRKKSPTPHSINNMKSAIKNKQKMTINYCL